MSKKRMKHDVLGTRMKDYYEQIPNSKLMRRTPVAIRIDGKAFHTFTRGFDRPFDEVLVKAMQDTTKYLCENIQGCVLGYTQSDEITLILVDYKHLDSSAWFDYKIQKICSVSASMATMAFNKAFAKRVAEYANEHAFDDGGSLTKTYMKAAETGALFDARCFNIPREEVTNLIYWRQVDASRNSVQMLGQAYFTQRQLQSKSSSQIQDMLMAEHDINWNDLSIVQKRGSCIIRDAAGQWFVDEAIPIFRGEDRRYIEDLIKPEEE